MDETKKQIIAITVSVFALIAVTTVLGAMLMRHDDPEPIVAPNIMDCDSLRQNYLDLYISNTRNEIILDRLYKKDSVLYNELTSNLE
jgi:hypothetical protein